MQSFFIYESNNKFEMYQFNFYEWVDIAKTSKANKILYSLGVAFIILTIFIFGYLSTFPEWLKGCAVLFETLGAIFLIPNFLSGDNILVRDNDTRPEKVLASRDLYFLRNCGRLTDGMFLYNVYYIQWEDGRGIIIDDTGQSLRGVIELVPYSAAESAKDSTLLIKNNSIKRSFSVDIINSDMVLDIVERSGIIDDVIGGPIKKEKTGKKILKKILEEC